jgi:rSAM/selenodomain-associated transferase 1
MDAAVIVMAKSPVPGRVKTRLHPPCTLQEAARIAEAALADTLAAVAASRAARRILVLDGSPGPWLPSGFEVIAQSPGSFGQRLEEAWRQVRGPAVQIGMDTPQVGPAVLNAALDRLDGTCAAAVLGPAVDGGWWSIGFGRPPRGAFAGVPMSRPDTGRRQRERLERLGLKVQLLEPMRDLDTWDDALALVSQIPASRTAAAVIDVWRARMR